MRDCRRFHTPGSSPVGGRPSRYGTSVTELRIDARQSPARARLIEPDELRSFTAVVLEADRSSPEWPAAVARHEEHVWVDVEALRALAVEAGAGRGWQSSFDAMIEFARSRGWVDDELGAVRAHVDRRTEADPHAG
jgi:hypothetical protein